MSNKNYGFFVLQLSIIQIIYVIKNIYAFNKGAGAPPHPPLILKRFLLYLFICIHLLLQICPFLPCLHLLVQICPFLQCLHLLVQICPFLPCLHLLVQICLLLLCPLLRLRDFLFDPNKEPTKPPKEKEPDAIIK